MRLVFEVILLVIVLFCAWNGYKKGLVMCIGTLLAIILSLYVGDLMGDTFSTTVRPVLRPFVSGYMDGSEGVISENLTGLLGADGADLSIDEALSGHPEIGKELSADSFKAIGIYDFAADKMADQALALSDENSIPLSSAIIDVACLRFAYVLIFTLFFLLSIIILTVLGNLFNLSFKIPEKEKLNTIGGAVAGAFTGIILCMLITWALRFCGALLPEETMTRTLITALFLKLNFMPLLLSI